MKMKEIILKIFSGIGLLFSAIFYVLYQQKKEENLEMKNEVLDASNKQQKQVMHDYSVNKEKADEELKKATGGNKLGNANAGLELLRK